MPAIGASIDPSAYRLMRAGRLNEALPLAQRAVVGAQTCLAAHGFLATLLLQLGRRQEAERVVAGAAELPGGDADAWDGLAYASMALGRHDRANILYRRASTLMPQSPRFAYNLACSERSLGRLAEAEAACDHCIALDPAQYATYLLRSELRVQVPDANHIAELQARLRGSNLDPQARAYLGYALGKELDDVQRFNEAFEVFAMAARARRSQLRYDVAGDEEKLRRIAAVFAKGISRNSVDDPRHRQGHGEDAQAMPRSASPSHAASSRCIFIVGLPRSGTTLVERILSGLAGVRSNGETENFSRCLAAAAPKGGGDMFERAAAADHKAVAEKYLRVAQLGAEGDRVIEKQPTNYLYLGAIHRALPDAKILLVRRSPMDSCFAMYRTLFGDAYPFAYDFDELARYYAAYERLMAHWRALLGDRLHEIVYEDLVREPARVGAAAARYCGLAWSADAIDIQNNKSVSLTASAAQVRRPIYGSSTGHWRRYGEQLAPLIAALRRYGVATSDDP